MKAEGLFRKISIKLFGLYLVTDVNAVVPFRTF
jgi:hypothetical protein